MLLLAAGLAGLVLLVSLLLRPDPAAQVEATFARIEAAIAAGDSQDLLANLDRDYHFGAQLPTRVRQAAEIDVDSGDLVQARRSLLRQLDRYFLFIAQQGRPQVFTYRIDEVDASTDPVVAWVNIGLTGGLQVEIDPPRPRHRFELRRHGWLWPETRIIAHDPFTL